MSKLPLYPIFLNLENAPVLIVGGGSVAVRKAASLLEAGAKVTVVAPMFSPDLDTLGVTRIEQPYAAHHMTAAPWRLVFATTDVPAVNAAVAADAAAEQIFCSRADAPDGSDFVNGASGSRGGVTVAVSTRYASPVIAVRLRDAALTGLDPVILEWTELLGPWRENALAGVPAAEARRALLKRIAGPEMEAILRQQGRSGAEERFAQWLREAMMGGADGC